jgi:hypothetical protein
MAKKKHNEDKKSHNSGAANDGGPDLTWQKGVDLVPEDEVEGCSEIYYLTDKDDNVTHRVLYGRTYS